MAVMKWEPIRDLISIKERMNRIFEESIARSRSKEDFEPVSWSPPVDMYENEDSIILKVEIPGINKSEIDVQLHRDTLILKGKRSRKKESSGEKYLLLERSFGAFTRVFNLPKTVRTDGIQANYKNGILELVLPKAKEAKPKKIKIASE
jgi:HSP20 family protein